MASHQGRATVVSTISHYPSYYHIIFVYSPIWDLGHNIKYQFILSLDVIIYVLAHKVCQTKTVELVIYFLILRFYNKQTKRRKKGVKSNNDCQKKCLLSDGGWSIEMGPNLVNRSTLRPSSVRGRVVSTRPPYKS